MSDYEKFKIGGVQFPLTAATTYSLLRDADPSLYWALDFWKSVLNTHLSARVVAEAAAGHTPIHAAVVDTLHIDPGSWLFEDAKPRFPLLCAYRVSTTYRDRTMVWEHTESEWDVAYILPSEFSTADNKRFVPLLRAAEIVLLNRTSQGFDPTYASGAKVWGSSYANLESIGFTTGRYSVYEAGHGKQAHQAIVMRCLVKERTMTPTGSLTAFAGADVDVQVQDGTTLDAVAQAKSDDLPPDGG